MRKAVQNAMHGMALSLHQSMMHNPHPAVDGMAPAPAWDAHALASLAPRRRVSGVWTCQHRGKGRPARLGASSRNGGAYPAVRQGVVQYTAPFPRTSTRARAHAHGEERGVRILFAPPPATRPAHGEERLEVWATMAGRALQCPRSACRMVDAPAQGEGPADAATGLLGASRGMSGAWSGLPSTLGSKGVDSIEPPSPGSALRTMGRASGSLMLASWTVPASCVPA